MTGMAGRTYAHDTIPNQVAILSKTRSAHIPSQTPIQILNQVPPEKGPRVHWVGYDIGSMYIYPMNRYIGDQHTHHKQGIPPRFTEDGGHSL